MAPSADVKKRSYVIEFLEDGLTAFGTVWSKGQRVTVVKDSREWATTINRRGEDSWVLLSNKGQLGRWGKVYFKRIQDVVQSDDVKGEAE